LKSDLKDNVYLIAIVRQFRSFVVKALKFTGLLFELVNCLFVQGTGQNLLETVYSVHLLIYINEMEIVEKVWEVENSWYRNLNKFNTNTVTLPHMGMTISHCHLIKVQSVAGGAFIKLAYFD
jgi:hypothetical protein